MRFKLHTDHHLALGRRHLSDGHPCQDHALSGVVKEYGEQSFAYAVISDGCSSAGETDIGARILTALTAKAIETEYRTGDEIYIYAQAWDAADLLGLNPIDLLATHLYAVIDVFGEGLVSISGDGAVAFLWKNGDFTVYKYEWAKEAPYYPMYDNIGAFWLAHGGREAKALTVSCWRKVGDEFIEVSKGQYTVEEGCRGMTLPIKVNPDIDNPGTDLSAICLFTDGVNKVDKVDWHDALQELTAFPNRTGLFVKRQLNFFIKKSQKIGLGPVDDIALAVITVEPVGDDQ